MRLLSVFLLRVAERLDREGPCGAEVGGEGTALSSDVTQGPALLPGQPGTLPTSVHKPSGGQEGAADQGGEPQGP